MGFISKYDLKFLTLMNRKYDKNFDYYDDYILWLFYNVSHENNELYYNKLEQDLGEYVELQSGKERDKKERINIKK